MRILHVEHRRYELPLRQAWTTATRRASSRVGYLLRLKADDGKVAYGDAAPQPDDDAARYTRCEHDLSALEAAVNGSPVNADYDPPLPTSVESPVRHAWTQAIFTLRALQQNKSLAVALADLAGVTPQAASIPVNATLPVASTSETVASARRAKAEGYACLKVKITGSPHEVRRIEAVRASVGPRMALRVDANGSWTEEAAPRLLKALAPLNLDYVEQPLPPGRIAALTHLSATSDVPIAVDESARHFDHATALIERRSVSVIVLKPMALGGLDHAVALLEAARRHKVRVVVTDSVESAVGRTAALHLAALLGPPTPPCGLASGTWLQRDLVDQPVPIERGVMRIPTGPGLGIPEPHFPREESN